MGSLLLCLPPFFYSPSLWFTSLLSQCLFIWHLLDPCLKHSCYPRDVKGNSNFLFFSVSCHDVYILSFIKKKIICSLVDLSCLYRKVHLRHPVIWCKLSIRQIRNRIKIWFQTTTIFATTLYGVKSLPLSVRNHASLMKSGLNNRN